MNDFKQLRLDSGMTIKEFADYFKIPLRTVQDWDSGKRTCKPYFLALMREKCHKMSKCV